MTKKELQEQLDSLRQSFHHKDQSLRDAATEIAKLEAQLQDSDYKLKLRKEERDITRERLKEVIVILEATIIIKTKPTIMTYDTHTGSLNKPITNINKSRSLRFLNHLLNICKGK